MSQQDLIDLCVKSTIKTKRAKSEKRLALQNAESALDVVEDKMELIMKKDPPLTDLLESWVKVQTTEQIAKRQVSLYIHLQMKSQGVIFEDEPVVKQIFKAKYEEILIFFYGKVKYPYDIQCEFYKNQKTKSNLIQQIRKEILRTVWELRKYHIDISRVEDQEVTSEEGSQPEGDKFTPTVDDHGEEKKEPISNEEDEINFSQISPTEAYTTISKYNCCVIFLITSTGSAAENDAFFKTTNLQQYTKAHPIFYVAKIYNDECHHPSQCGKIKLGYVTSQTKELPGYHETRMTQLCPSVDFYWLSIDGVDAKDAKEAGQDWERRVFLDSTIKQHRLYSDKELFSITLPVETILKIAKEIGEMVSSIYKGNFNSIRFSILL